MRFFNKWLDKIFRYIQTHDGETLLIKDIASDLGTTVVTVRKYIKWLERRKIIKRTGKRFFTVDQFED